MMLDLILRDVKEEPNMENFQTIEPENIQEWY